MDLLIFLLMTGLGVGMMLDPTSQGSVVVPPALGEQTTHFEAEDQTPTGKFMTASEVKLIIEAIKPQWIAVRLWDGQDLLYFTNLLSWRCGTHQISYAVNGGDFQVLQAEPCHSDDAAPNALKTADGFLPYVTFKANSIQTIEVQVLYDDLSETDESYARAQVQID